MAVVNPLLVLAVVMLGLLLAVPVGILLLRNWNDYQPTLRTEEAGLTERILKSPISWTLSFFLGSLLLAATITTWMVAPPDLQGTVAAGAIGVIGILIAVLVFTGAWDFIKSQDRSNSEAVAVGSILVGLLFVIAISARLLLG